MNCNKCGAKVEEGSKFCNSCGNPIDVSKKSNNKLIIIVVGIILLLAIGTTVAIVVHNSFKSDETRETKKDSSSLDKKDKEKDNEVKKEEKSAPETLDLSSIKEIKPDNNETDRNSKFQFLNAFYKKDETKFGHVSFLLKNNNTEVLDVTVYLNIYKDEVRINSFSWTQSNLKANSEFVADMTFDYVEEYDNMDLTVKTKKASSYYIDYQIKKEDLQINKITEYGISTITALYKNPLQKELVIYGGCKYLKEGKVVFASNSIMTLKQGETGDLNFFDSSMPKGIEYDNYEIMIYSAYYKDDNY